MLCSTANARILLGQLVQRGGELLLLALVRGLHAPGRTSASGNASGARWIWSSSCASCSTASKWISSTLATAAMSPGIACAISMCSLPLSLNRCADLERLLAVVDEQLRVLAHGALVDAEHAELADERIVDDLEHVGDHVRVRIGPRVDRRGVVAAALDERRRIGFAGMRQQPFGDVEQFRACPRRCARRRNTPAPGGLRAGIARTHRAVPGRCRPDFACVEVMVHHRFVDLDHLVDDLLVPVGDRAEIAGAGRIA